MFVLGLTIYLIATTSLTANVAIIATAFFVDVTAWAAIQNSFEAWATGTTSDQEFWNND